MHEGADGRAEIIEVQRLLKVRGEAAEPHPGKLVGGARDGDHGDAATLVVRLLTQPGDERCARLPDKRGVGDDQIDLDRPHIRRASIVSPAISTRAPHIVSTSASAWRLSAWSSMTRMMEPRPRALARNLFACARRARVQRSRRAPTADGARYTAGAAERK